MNRIAQLRARIQRAEDRIVRTTTTEDYLTEIKIIQDANEEIDRIQEKDRIASLMDDFNYVGSRHHY